MVDREAWTPPAAPARKSTDRVPGALGGSLLLDIPAHAALRAELLAFLDRPGPLGVEVGFDHGITLLDQARRSPEWRWIGLEIRRRRVEAIRPLAPDNCLPLRLDARTLFGSGLMDGRVDRVDVLFPTPSEKGRHLLWTPGFARDVARALRPGGVLTVATDVPALAGLVQELLAGWEPAPPPPRGDALSRRERVCRRDGIAVWWGSFRPPG